MKNFIFNPSLNTAAAVILVVVLFVTYRGRKISSQYRRSSNPCGLQFILHLDMRFLRLNTAAAVILVVYEKELYRGDLSESQYRRSSNPCGH